MKKYKVTIVRTEYQTMDFEVDAESIHEAIGNATEEAYNADWRRGEADYTADDVVEIK